LRAAEMLAALRERGDKRVVVIAVPTHKLGDEQARALEALPEARAAGLTAAVWRGREREDPDAPGTTMCRDLERIDDANDCLLTVQTAVCKRKIPEGYVYCPLFRACGYQRQLQRSPDVWIIAHELLFTQKPAAIGDVAAVIVDESAWQDGLQGAGGTEMTLSLDSLQAPDEVPFDPAGTLLLQHLRRVAFDALSAAPDGPVSRDTMLQAPLPAASAAEAYKLEWMRKVDPGMHPGMSRQERKAAVIAGSRNKAIARLGMFWRAMEALTSEGGPGASGWAALGWKETPEGAIRVLKLKGRKPVREGWQAPTLLLDATMNIDLVRHHWPDAKLVADIDVEAPHQRVRQVADASFSKRRLIPWEKSNEAVLRAGKRNLRDLHATLATIGRNYAPGRVLAVVQMGVEEALPAFGRLPPNVELAHHNDIAGKDGWRDVAALVVVGRTAPQPAAVERIAEALTGAAITPLPGWYERRCTTREMADGSALEAEADWHPHPIAEAVRWQIAEGELVQIIGRARGVNRTDADPVVVLVMTDVPLPLPVDETLSASDLAPTPAELMLAAGGIAFENSTDAAVAYSHLWESREAAKKALQRERLGTNPYKESSNTGMSPTSACLRRVDYQRIGSGMKPAVAWCDPAMVPDPDAGIAERLNTKLAWCR
jgi:putative DNA primase/helicase